MESSDSLVNWKLFELQAALIADDVDPRYMVICKEWFTKKHFQDVIEERNNDSKCGYPLCSEEVASTFGSPVRGRTVVAPSNVEETYCSDRCTASAHEFQLSLLDTHPSSRDVAKNLRPPPRKERVDEEILSLLDTLVGHKEPETAFPVIQPLHRQTNKGRSADLAANSEIRFGPADDSDGPPATDAVAREPPSVRVPVDKSLLPSARLGQRKDTAPSKLLPLTGATTSGPETQDSGIPPRDPQAGPDRQGFLWMDKDDKQCNSNKSESEEVIESKNEQDLQLEELDDGTPSVDPRKSAEVTEWTDSWAQITGENAPGKYKRPIRRFPPKGSRSRSVQWADGKNNDAEVSTEKQAAKVTVPFQSQPRGTVVEKKAPAVAPLKSVSEKGKSRPIQTTIIEREPSLPAPLNRKGMAGVFPADRGSEIAPVAELKNTETPGESTVGGIEGYQPMLESIRVAPSTMLKDLSFDPLGGKQDENEKAEDERILQELFGSKLTLDSAAPGAIDVSDADATTEDPDAKEADSWFVSLWSAMEDLFDYECIMSFNDTRNVVDEPPSVPDADDVHWSGDEDDIDDAADDPYMAGNSMAGVKAVRNMVQSGIKCAENAIFSKRKLCTSEMNKYMACKSRLIATASLNRSHHFSLTSTQWNMLGAIIVCSVIARADLEDVVNVGRRTWHHHAHSVMHSLMAKAVQSGDSSSKHPLDESELDILLNFFQVDA